MQLSSGEYLSDIYIYILFCLLFCPFQILKKVCSLEFVGKVFRLPFEKVY